MLVPTRSVKYSVYLYIYAHARVDTLAVNYKQNDPWTEAEEREVRATLWNAHFRMGKYILL